MDSLEEWRPVIGFEGHYEVSNKGNVRSLDRTIFDLNGRRKRFIKGVALKPSKDKDGYCFVRLHSQGSGYTYFKVHRLVALIFIPNPNNLPCVNHIDFNRSNNIVENLEWCSSKQNYEHSMRAGRIHSNKGMRGKAWKSTRLLLMLDLEGNYIRSFYGAREAADFLGFKSCVNIYSYLSGKCKSAYGHLWKVGIRVSLPEDERFRDFQDFYR